MQQFQISESKNGDNKMEASPPTQKSGFVSFVKKTWSSSTLHTYLPKLNSDGVKNNEDSCPLILEADSKILNNDKDSSLESKSFNYENCFENLKLVLLPEGQSNRDSLDVDIQVLSQSLREAEASFEKFLSTRDKSFSQQNDSMIGVDNLSISSMESDDCKYCVPDTTSDRDTSIQEFFSGDSD